MSDGKGNQRRRLNSRLCSYCGKVSDRGCIRKCRDCSGMSPRSGASRKRGELTSIIYFNDFDRFNAEWLRALYIGASISEQSIAELEQTDLARFRRVHLFAGIGGWEEALSLAGWPDDWPIWTGSCPCQPYSVAGKRKGEADHRDLWPEMYRLVRECRPGVVVGEQVPGAIGHGWLDRVSADLEAEGYAVGAVVLGAHSVGAPQKRDRLYWAAVELGYLEGDGWDQGGAEPNRRDASTTSDDRSVGDSSGTRHTRRTQPPARTKRQTAKRAGDSGGVDGADDYGRPEAVPMRQPRPKKATTKQLGIVARLSSWEACRTIVCRDGKHRRISAECGDEPVAYGIPRDARAIIARLCELGESPANARRIVREARTNRSGRLRGYGNAIVPQVAAVFVRALMETLAERSGSDERPTDGHRTAAEDRGGGVASEND